MKKTTLLIMAAGMGSRYGGSKQIDPMGPHGEIILDYSVYDAIQAGFEKIIFILGKKFAEDFQKTMETRLKGKIQAEYICQELEDLPPGFHSPSGRKKPWGTGHAILSCRKILESPFAVINADDFYGREAFEIAYRELNQKKDLSGQGFLVGYRLDKTLSPHGSVTRGICETHNGRLRKIVERMSINQTESGNVEFTENNEKRPIATDAVVSMNFWGFPVDFMDMLLERFISFLSKSGRELKSEYLLPEVVDYFINKGMLRINVLSSNSQWFGVTYREDKPGVQAELAKMNSYPSPLW